MVLAQTVKDLKNRSKQPSGTESPSKPNTSNYGGSTDGGSAADGLVGCFYGCLFMGDMLVKLGDEEGRLLKRNVEESRLFAVEGDLSGAFGFRDFAKIHGQLRLHLGLVSLGFRKYQLFDKTGTFNTEDYMAYLNIINIKELKVRGLVGLLYFNFTNRTYLQYGGAIEFFPTRNTRVEIFGSLSPLEETRFGRPRQEIGFRFHYDIRRKGFLNTSIFTGASNQLYFSDLNFPGIEIGLNCFLAFNRFIPKVPKQNQSPQNGGGEQL